MEPTHLIADFMRANPWAITLSLLLFIMLVYWGYNTYLGSEWYNRKRNYGWQETIRKRVGLSSEIWDRLSYVQRCAVKDIWASCNANGVALKLESGTMVSYTGEESSESKVSGYFLGDEQGHSPVLSAAAGKDPQDFIDVLLHESCHMDQWSEGSKVWKDLWIEGRDAYDILWDWMGCKTDMDESRIEQVVLRCMACELDCERRVVEKLRKYNMGDRVDEYCQKANSYIWGYYVSKLRRRWYSVPPYEVKEVWGRMPRLLMELDEYRRMDWETLTYYDRFCFSNKVGRAIEN